MEPDNLKAPISPDDAHLEAWLREHSTRPPLPDDGFTQRVLTALPLSGNRQTAHRRLAILLGTGIGSAVSVWLYPGTSDSLTLSPTLQSDLAHALVLLMTPNVGLALAVTAGSLLFAYRHQLRQLVPW